MSNRAKLRQLLLDVFLLEESEFRFDLSQEQVETWDSLGTISLAVGVEQTFGYHFTQEEAMSIRTFQDIIDILESKGISLDDVAA